MKRIPLEVAVLDACVLYSAPCRDFLLNLALVKLYEPKWSHRINEEWVRSILLRRPDLSLDQLVRTVDFMNINFPEANTPALNENFLIRLPDEHDVHVVQTAATANASIILTFNLQDFPKQALAPFGIKAVHPDTYCLELIHRYPSIAMNAFITQVRTLRKPPMSSEQVIDRLRNAQLPRSADALRRNLKSVR